MAGQRQGCRHRDLYSLAVVLFLIVVGGAGDIVAMVRSLLEHREKTEAEIGRDKS